MTPEHPESLRAYVHDLTDRLPQNPRLLQALLTVMQEFVRLLPVDVPPPHEMPPC